LFVTHSSVVRYTRLTCSLTRGELFLPQSFKVFFSRAGDDEQKWAAHLNSIHNKIKKLVIKIFKVALLAW